MAPLAGLKSMFEKSELFGTSHHIIPSIQATAAPGRGRLVFSFFPFQSAINHQFGLRKRKTGRRDEDEESPQINAEKESRPRKFTSERKSPLLPFWIIAQFEGQHCSLLCALSIWFVTPRPNSWAQSETRTLSVSL